MRLRAALLPFALAGLLLVGCGGDDGSDEADETTTTEADESEDTTTTVAEELEGFCQAYEELIASEEAEGATSLDAYRENAATLTEELEAITPSVPVDLVPTVEALQPIVAEYQTQLEAATTDEEGATAAVAAATSPEAIEAGAVCGIEPEETTTTEGEGDEEEPSQYEAFCQAYEELREINDSQDTSSLEGYREGAATLADGLDEIVLTVQVDLLPAVEVFQEIVVDYQAQLEAATTVEEAAAAAAAVATAPEAIEAGSLLEDRYQAVCVAAEEPAGDETTTTVAE